MTKLIGKFLILTFRNSEAGFKFRLFLYPNGKWGEVNDPFYKDWGTVCFESHIWKWRCSIHYRFGRLIPRSIPAWAK